MNSEKQIEFFSEKYRKYIVLIKVYENNYYMITGADLSDNENDKILLNEYNKILLSNNILVLLEYVTNHKVFDNRNFKQWVVYIKPLIKKSLGYRYAEFRMENVEKKYIINLEKTLSKPFKRDYNEYIDFVNLINDYAIQIHYKLLLKLNKEQNIKLFWEHCYDMSIWNRKNPQMVKKEFMKKFNKDKFRVSLSKLYSLFLSNVRII